MRRRATLHQSRPTASATAIRSTRCEIADRRHDADCNLNGIPDQCELTTETDCNGNGVLDECELTT